MQAVQVTSPGGPHQLELTSLPDPDPGPGQVVVSVLAAGVNYIDTYQRGGMYPVSMPFVPGLEGTGRVMTVGTGVDTFGPGDLVGWTDVLGSYAEQVVLPVPRIVPVPEELAADTAAAVMLQGLTAHYLSQDTYRIRTGDRCLVHAGAGGVGQLLIQMAKRAGAEVFTTVSTAAKADLARAAGADHTIVYTEQDFGDAIEAIAGARPLDVVYDGVGRSTFDRGLGLLRRRGTMVTFGNASGPVEAISPLRLTTEGSLYLTRPSMADYIATEAELRSRVGEVFSLVASGELKVRIGARFPLSEASRAHEMLEGRETTGKILLDVATR
jgi:NADPH2:quinone reductase